MPCRDSGNDFRFPDIAWSFSRLTDLKLGSLKSFLAATNRNEPRFKSFLGMNRNDSILNPYFSFILSFLLSSNATWIGSDLKQGLLLNLFYLPTLEKKLDNRLIFLETSVVLSRFLKNSQKQALFWVVSGRNDQKQA